MRFFFFGLLTLYPSFSLLFPPSLQLFATAATPTSPHPQLVRRFLVSFYVLDIFCVYVYSMPREYILHFDSRVNCYRVQNIFQIFCLFICSFT